MKIELIEHDVRKQHLRFYELLSLYRKENNRQSLVYVDHGYVTDTETFLTGCLSRLIDVSLYIDGSELQWEILGIENCRKFKTLLDFCENKLTCQDLYNKDLEPHMRDWISHRLQFLAHVINPGAKDKEKIRNFLNL
jgi:hypothetical protein